MPAKSASRKPAPASGTAAVPPAETTSDPAAGAASVKTGAAGTGGSKTAAGKTAAGKTAAGKAAAATNSSAKAAPSKTVPAKSAAPAEPELPEDDAPRRPLPVTIVAGVTSVIGALLLGYGIYLMAAGFTGKPVLLGRAELAGGIFVLFGASLLWVARGLMRLQAWARTPAFIAQLAFFGVCYWTVQGHDYVGAVVSALFGVGGSVMLFLPSSNAVLNRDIHF